MIDLQSLKRKRSAVSSKWGTVRLDNELLEELRGFCNEKDIPISSLLREIIQEFLREQSKNV